MLWSGWGEPTRATTVSPALLELLHGALGVRGTPPAVALADVQVAPSRLSDRARSRLTRLLGAEHVGEDHDSRVFHTRGKSTPDLLRIRAGDAADAPDAVLLPGSHEQVLELLALCSDERLAVVPFGGGTSVVGGLTPERDQLDAVVALDLGRMRSMLELDEVSRVATLEAGLRGPEAEALLAEHGYVLGHYPQSFEFASIGGFAAARSSGQASAGYGRFDERVVGLRLATPRGSLDFGRAPKSAAGPDLRQLFLGSEGAFGVITSLRVEVGPLPDVRVYEGWRFGSFRQGCEALRRLAQDGPLPSVLRLSDEAETAVNLARPDQIGAGTGAGALAVAGYEGTAKDVADRQAGAGRLLRELGAELDADAGEAWLRGRYAAPYLRDAMLDAGALVETLETATFWSGLEELHRAVRSALAATLTELGSPPVVLCHVSHLYRSGASLYFTVGAAQLEDPLSQWRAAKRAAGDAIIAAGGSITHHHGVGTEHREHYGQEVGQLALEALRAVKDTLDPAGVLNPGVLLG